MIHKKQPINISIIVVFIFGWISLLPIVIFAQTQATDTVVLKLEHQSIIKATTCVDNAIQGLAIVRNITGDDSIIERIDRINSLVEESKNEDIRILALFVGVCNGAINVLKDYIDKHDLYSIPIISTLIKVAEEQKQSSYLLMKVSTLIDYGFIDQKYHQRVYDSLQMPEELTK